MRNPRLLAPILGGALSTAAVTAGLLQPVIADQDLPAPPLPPATRGPLRIAFDPAGKQAYVTESDEGTVAVIDTTTGGVLRRLPTGG